MTISTITKPAHQNQSKKDDFNSQQTVVRVETNFERLPIWSLKPKRGTQFIPSKIITLEPETLTDGSTVQRTIEIVPTQKFGYPTVQTQEYWYALQKLWHESPDKETGIIEFSRRQIIEDILGKTYGRQSRRALDLSISQLGTTRFEFEYVFHDKVQEETYQKLDKFHLIIRESLSEKKRRNEIVHDKCSVTLHPLVVSNLLSGYYKPILLSVVSHLKSDIARLLYRKLDLQFSYYSKYEISTERFFKEHALGGSEYHKPSVRKRLLEKAVKELIGKPTSSGAVITSYELLKTADGKDWKIIVLSDQKNSSKTQDTLVSLPPPPTRETVHHSSSDLPSSPQSPKDQQSNLSSETSEVLRYFQEKFLDENALNPSKKVREKAAEILKRHGIKKIKFFIDFAQQKAQETGYRPKTLNGIVQYLPEALKALQKEERQARIRQQNEQEREKQRRDLARIEHEKEYMDMYCDSLYELIEKILETQPQEIERYRQWEVEQREEALRDLKNEGLKETRKRFFEKESQIALRLCRFFQDHPEIHVPNFWEWDREYNPNRFPH